MADTCRVPASSVSKTSYALAVGSPLNYDTMTHDWLLVETLGSEPAVVAQGRQLKNLVPVSVFLRRNPLLSAIQTAIAETGTHFKNIC